MYVVHTKDNFSSEIFFFFFHAPSDRNWGNNASQNINTEWPSLGYLKWNQIAEPYSPESRPFV